MHVASFQIRVCNFILCFKSTDSTHRPGVTGRNFPKVIFFPGERMGQPILSPGKFPTGPFFPHPVSFFPLIIFKNHNTYSFFFKKLESHYSVIDETHAFWCFVVIWKVGKVWADMVSPPPPPPPPLQIFLISIYLFNLCYSFTFSMLVSTLMNELKQDDNNIFKPSS